MQQWIDEERQEGRQEEALSIALRQLHRRVGLLDVETQNRIRALPLEQLELLIFDLLDFESHEDLERWLRDNERPQNSDSQPQSV